MNGVSGISSAMHMAAGSLTVHAVGIQTGGHNIANISTDGFAPQRATYADGPGGRGVALETVRKLQNPQADIVSLSERGKALANILPESGTELAKEMPRMIQNQRGFEANAAVIHAADEMFGTIINSVA